MSERRISLPQEHGAFVTLAGAALLAALLAPAPLVALAAAAAVTALYLARGPIERMVKRLSLRAWDLPALLLYAAVAASCLWVVADERAQAAWLVGALAVAIPSAGAATRTAKLRRSIVVEVGGMLVVGATAGAALYAGGGPAVEAGAVAIALASYSAAAIFTVRAQTRPLERRQRVTGAWVGVALLAAGAGGVAALQPRIVFAFCPRLAHALARTVVIRHSKRIGLVALRESLELALFAVLIAVISGVG